LSIGLYCKRPFIFVFQPNEKDSVCLKSDLEQVQQESRELQERLMVSEATVQAQAEQLKDYRELLSECFQEIFFYSNKDPNIFQIVFC